MSTVSVTNTFVNGTANDGPQVNTNFSDLVSYINNQCITKDGALSFTGSISQPNAPTSANHLTNKTYVDGLVGRQSSSASGSAYTPGLSGVYLDVTGALITITNPGKAVVVEAWLNWMITAGAGGSGFYQNRLYISFDNGATYSTFSTQNKYTAPAGTDFSGSTFVTKSGTPTGDIKIKYATYQSAGYGAFGTVNEWYMLADMFKTVSV